MSEMKVQEILENKLCLNVKDIEMDHQPRNLKEHRFTSIYNQIYSELIKKTGVDRSCCLSCMKPGRGVSLQLKLIIKPRKSYGAVHVRLYDKLFLIINNNYNEPF